ncbi:MAG: hypothetical protein HYZ75_15685 [Elusimicrobia bacterium]|nr:hypothetical protein [Elusimicrobiota bacterium]
MVDIAKQHFVIARFADYCAYTRPYPHGVTDPVHYLLEKLGELEEPLNVLKQGILEGHMKRFFSEAAAGVSEAQAADFRSVLEGYLAPADFVDVCFHLMEPAGLKDPGRLKLAVECARRMRAARLIDEEAKPEERRSKLYKRLSLELTKRLGFDKLEEVRARRPLDARRLRMLLRRARRETAEYATVFHFPASPDDTFTPFIIPRVESLVAVNRRFLRSLRMR